MSKKYLAAKTFKKKGGAAIELEHAPDFLAYVPQLEDQFKRKAEFLILTADDQMTLDEAWPEYAPFAIAETKEEFEKSIEEKSSRGK